MNGLVSSCISASLTHYSSFHSFIPFSNDRTRHHRLKTASRHTDQQRYIMLIHHQVSTKKQQPFENKFFIRRRTRSTDIHTTCHNMTDAPWIFHKKNPTDTNCTFFFASVHGGCCVLKCSDSCLSPSPAFMPHKTDKQFLKSKKLFK